MTSEKIHEQYGWLAHQEGFFNEWREEVSFRISKLNLHESRLAQHRAELSIQVFKEMLESKQQDLHLGE